MARVQVELDRYLRRRLGSTPLTFPSLEAAHAYQEKHGGRIILSPHFTRVAHEQDGA